MGCNEVEFEVIKVADSRPGIPTAVAKVAPLQEERGKKEIQGFMAQFNACSVRKAS